jgi:hypothetical protein
MISKKNNTKFILTILILLLCNSAFAWEQFKTYDILIDKESIYTSKNSKGNKEVNVWAIWDIPPPPELPRAKSVKALLNFDCEARFVSFTTVLVYDMPKASGRQLKSSYFNGMHVDPDTFYGDLHKTYCKDWWKVW